ncbi:MAG: B12-binding domain-containing radical SAM protein, partial [Spirochaetae bacterium HGW-Spirochaetae-8]
GMCFPDLYEIGMSNNAVRILYDIINSIDSSILCDLVYSVAPDYENLLRERNIPLHTLEHGMPLRELDLLCISVGYELAATNILQVLDLGKIPLHSFERHQSDPIVIAGGPAITNPLPFSPFLDFVYIGEAESGLKDVVLTLQHMNKRGATRTEKIEKLKTFDFLWYPGKKVARRAIDDSFASEEGIHTYSHYVVPNFKVAQDNGVVEIMRGCPNGCRFCHAGQYYKPYRQKSFKIIQNQVRQNIENFGFREITLSSLSSGDHPYIREIIETLNQEWIPRHISFALPSLKVSSFSLGILEQLSEVRKSGLTFAIETPLLKWQRAVNKEAPLEQVVEIINEARKRGWRLAKFYFMVGLPFINPEEEKSAIIDFLRQVHQVTRINMNINIGTFIPKPHTPFQWAPQLHPDVARTHLMAIKRGIQQEIKGSKVSYHEPFVSYIEGLISRGDERTSRLIEHAYLHGCRLDAWDDYIKEDVWRTAIGAMDFPVDECIFVERDPADALSWDSVSLRVSNQFMRSEWEAAKEMLLTDRCLQVCDHPCGVCGKVAEVVDTTERDKDLELLRQNHTALDFNQLEALRKKELEDTIEAEKLAKPVLLIYRKEGRAAYISHISVMRIVEQTFQRSGIPLMFTQGFNPKPRLEFVNPLSLGITGAQEVLLADISIQPGADLQVFLQLLNANISDGFVFTDIRMIQSEKKVTLSKLLGGSVYTISHIADPFIESQIELKIPGDLLAQGFRIQKKFSEDGAGFYQMVVSGEKNAIKLLFGAEVDKFHILSKCAFHREMLFVGEYSDIKPVFDYRNSGSIWQ